MTAWAGLTYGNVKEYILAVAGDCCSDTPQLEALMSAAVQEMYVRLEDCEPIAETRIVTVAGQADYPLPCVPGLTGEATTVFLEKVMGVLDVNGNRLQQHTNRCDLALGTCCCPPGTVPWDPWCTTWQIRSTPTDAMTPGFDNNRTVTFHPTPVDVQTYTLQGHIPFDPTLWEVSGEPPAKYWFGVRLPVGLHYAYQELALALNLRGVDVTRANLASSSSAQMFQAWKDRQVRSDYPLGTTMVIGRNSKFGSYLGDEDYYDSYPIEVFQKVAP